MVLVTETERKILLGRPMRKFEDNIKIDLKKSVGRARTDRFGSV